MPELVLYYFESCPFCQKVLRYLKKRGIEVTLKNTHQDQEAKKELIEVGGKYQVPCLFIDGEPLYESDDIIQWFEDNY
ncbi:MAG: hypothetical protein PWR10_207 [Halanaerobiales bacterium]|nr:hypothetical protein [Halanaerobiales bacterium]